MKNIDVLKDEPYLEPGTVRIAVHNTVHTENYWRHSHNFYEFVYVVDGFTLHSYNGKTSILAGGDLFAIYPGNNHSYIAAYNANIYNILFYPEELGDAAPELERIMRYAQGGDGNFPSVRVELAERSELISLLELMIRERRERRYGYEAVLKASLVKFIVTVSRFMSEKSSSESSRRGYCGYIYNVLSYIEENFARDIDSTALANAAGLSSDHLARQFKSVMGMTPTEYLRRFRVAKAMDMLKTTDSSISEIAAATGFSDISLFSRVFKQTVGTSPAVFRKE